MNPFRGQARIFLKNKSNPQKYFYLTFILDVCFIEKIKEVPNGTRKNGLLSSNKCSAHNEYRAMVGNFFIDGYTDSKHYYDYSLVSQQK